VGVMRVSAAYFATAGIPMLRGTAFDETNSAQPLIIIDDEVARRLFGSQEPVRAEVSLPGGANLATVVGVVAHVRSGGPEGAQGLQVYWPLPLAERGGPPQFLIRLSRPVASVGASLQQSLGRFVRAGAHPATLTAIDDAFRRLTAQRRFSASLMAIFGLLALFIGSAGLYGVMSSVVAQQTREFAVRVALGATPGQVSRGILRQASGYLLAGLALGLPVAWWVSRGFTASLYGVHPTDAFVYVLVAVVLAATGLLASWRPARRAARVDPIVALKTG
jgi:hypothetical protein